MSAIILTTSEVIEATIVLNSNVVACKYFEKTDSQAENKAIDFVDSFNVESIEFESLSI